MTTSQPLRVRDPVDVAAWAADGPGDEPMGPKEKFWVTDESGHPWLFKFAREHQGSPLRS